MKKSFKSIFVLLSLATMLAGCNSGEGGSGSTTTPEESVEPGLYFEDSKTYKGNYYDSIDSSLTGSNLRSALNTLNTQKRKRMITYGGFKEFYKYSEIDWNGTTPEGKMIGFYDNALVNNYWDSQATWNREHVWPNSLGGSSVEGDAHMTRPTSVSINSGRGNSYYAASGAYDPGQYDVNYRGVAARIIFYCAIADTNLNIIDATKGGSNQMGKLSDLLKWNLQYAPNRSKDAALALRVEQNRNQIIGIETRGQGNRNPFIDHPEYACKIWGSTNSTTKQICGM